VEDVRHGPALAFLIPHHGRGLQQMTLKIETASDGRTATLRLSGRIDAEYVDELRAEIRRHRPWLVLDLDDVTLVDVAVVRFLIACEAEGIELRHCARYIREWMSRERGQWE
jgi:hypothetical protein